MARGYTYMPFGSRKGEKIKELPTSYLRGFAHPRFRGRLRHERLLRSIEIEIDRRKRGAK